MTSEPVVVAVHRSARHGFTKASYEVITLLAGLGIEGDAHCGATVQHRYDKRKDPKRPNLRQVHLIQSEVLDDVRERGFRVLPGELGENITTRNLDVLRLPTGTQLAIGDDAIVEVTGLRKPCAQIERFQTGLLAEMVERRAAGRARSKTGVMGVVICGGAVRPGDAIRIRLPSGDPVPLKPI